MSTHSGPGIAPESERRLLGRRYRAGGEAILPLSRSQIAARDEIAAQLSSGSYGLVRVDCPACGGSAKWVVAERDMYGLPMEVAICRDCGLVYTSKRLADQTLSRFYDEEYRRLDRAEPLESSGFFELQRDKGETLWSYLYGNGVRPAADRPIVEIGCGAGGILAAFRDRGYRTIGVDLGSEYVRFGVERFGLELYIGDLNVVRRILEREKLVPGLVIYEQVLEHLADPRRELASVRELMDDESFLFVGVPGLRTIDSHYRSDFLRYLQIPHLVHFELRTLARLLGSNGLELVRGDERTFSLVKRSSRRFELAGPTAQQTLAFLRRLERRRRLEATRDAPARLISGLRAVLGGQLERVGIRMRR